jgi:ribose transport system substrate-binding protein
MSQLRSFVARGAIAGALVAAVLLVAGCGSSSSSNSSSAAAAANATPAATTSSTASSGGGGSALATAEAAIKQYSAIPQFTAPGPKVDAAKLKGKKILVVDACMCAQQLVSIDDGIQAAAKATGLSVSFFNGNVTQSTIEQGIQQGITDKVAGIILSGWSPNAVPSSVAAAKAAGIPIVGDSLGLNVSNPDVFGLSSPNYVLVGKLMGDAAIQAENGKKITADAITFTNPAVNDALSGIESVFKTCGGSCTIYKSVDIEPTDWPTQIPASTVAMVKANPNVNVFFGVVDDTLGSLIATGVREADATNVKVIGGQGSGSAPLAVVQQGGAYVADPGQSAVWTGWGSVDQLMRAMLGMKPGADVTPTRFLGSATLKGTNVNNASSIYGDAYVSGFESLWGVK